MECPPVGEIRCQVTAQAPTVAYLVADQADPCRACKKHNNPCIYIYVYVYMYICIYICIYIMYICMCMNNSYEYIYSLYKHIDWVYGQNYAYILTLNEVGPSQTLHTLSR